MEIKNNNCEVCGSEKTKISSELNSYCIENKYILQYTLICEECGSQGGYY